MYHLELYNPFSKSAKTYLVGVFHEQPFKVILPIGRIGGYGDTARPSDWVILLPAREASRFTAQVTVDPGETYIFFVDLKMETAKMLERAPRR